MRPPELAPEVEELKRSGELPRHVAVIMDGNGRWATKRGLPRVAGHQAARRSVREVVQGCAELKIAYLTLYTFSTENWHRPRPEVSALMAFLRQVLIEERDELARNNVRMRVIGQIEDLPSEVRAALDAAMQYLAGNTGLELILALSYSGRRELTLGFQKLAEKIERGELKAEEIREELIEAHLATAGIPHPDLLIRTSGEQRLSNFLLWQLAYAEIYVTQTLWPDFRKKDLYKALLDYQKRNRRFGRVE